MSDREHLVAVLDTASDTGSTIDVARDAVRRGGRVTLVVLLATQDRRSIEALADAERLSIGDAEALYVDRVCDAFQDDVGGADTTTIVRYRPSSARDILAAAAWSKPTALAIPSTLTRHRGWRSALSTTPVPVHVTPARAA